MSKDQYIPMTSWGKDHWSTLAYFQSINIDYAGFQVGFDPRMRQNRRHFRVMMALQPTTKHNKSSNGVVMADEYGSRLKDKSIVDGHDDWMCIQDMAQEGLFTVPDAEDIEPGAILHLSEHGWRVIIALQKHKASGGTFSNFDVETIV